MSKTNVVAIFDVGKTNKKLFLFDKGYKIIYEESRNFEEIKDEDGFPCEDLSALSKWIHERITSISLSADYNLIAVNFAAYGASFVHIDEMHKPLTPLYNYLKPYPENLKQQFYNTYGDESLIARQTASPTLGNLNSGMQLYRLKYEQPEIFSRVKYSLASSPIFKLYCFFKIIVLILQASVAIQSYGIFKKIIIMSGCLKKKQI